MTISNLTPEASIISFFVRPWATRTSSLDKNTLKDIIRETIEEVLSENGLLVESTSKTNDVFQFRVGSHIFEGKVTKIKKIK
jgi:hypothetical protein